jgi:hypothetical protein
VPRIDSILEKASFTSDRETEKNVEKMVKEQLKGNLARFEQLSPRGVQKDYENINEILDELDA